MAAWRGQKNLITDFLRRALHDDADADAATATSTAKLTVAVTFACTIISFARYFEEEQITLKSGKRNSCSK